MECERLQRLVKSWYVQVQDEAMAPARMISLMEKHIVECHTCLADPLVRKEVEKISAIVLPPTKIRKPTERDEDDEDDSPLDAEDEADDSEDDEEEVVDEEEEEEDDLDEIDDDAIGNVD
ncbi:MAG: hypothetical protein OEY01_14205 [Desulfobulbaceae bacterium]|nr:hypothetical protein [Desulfobulbaceae bacterium]